VGEDQSCKNGSDFVGPLGKFIGHRGGSEGPDEGLTSVLQVGEIDRGVFERVFAGKDLYEKETKSQSRRSAFFYSHY